MRESEHMGARQGQRESKILNRFSVQDGAHRRACHYGLTERLDLMTVRS